MFALNPQQDKAVKTIAHHLLVLAGAGSGKTRIIVAKIFYLLSQGVLPENILAITFTNKAASEMKSRIVELLESQSESLSKYRTNEETIRLLEVRTFHSFGAKLLRYFISRLSLNGVTPYDSNFSIIDGEDQKRLLRKLILKINPEEKPEASHIRILVHLFSSWKNEFVYPSHSSVSGEAETQMEKSFSYRKNHFPFSSEYAIRLYRCYVEYLQRYNLLDFDDLIGLSVQLLKTDSYVNEWATSRWKYLLVDEYQDTNVSQEKLIEVFIRGGSISTVVGDDSQSIYGFRGAHLENIISYKDKYKGVELVKLEENYRSTQSILNLANRVISFNPVKFEKNLFTQQGEGERPSYQQFYNDFYEAGWLVEQIKELVSQGVSLSEVAILYRTNYQSRVLEDGLMREQIPYKIIGGLRFYERKEVKDLLCYLSWLVNPRDQVAFSRLINFPARGIGEKTLAKFMNYFSQVELEIKSNSNLENRDENLGWRLINQLFDEGRLRENFSSKVVESLLRLKRMGLEALEGIDEGVPISKIVDGVLHGSGLYRYYSELKDEMERDQRMGNLDAFMDAVIAFEDYLVEQRNFLEKSGDRDENFDSDKNNQLELPPLVQFMENISLGQEKDEESELIERVNLLTVHNAKGLEYERVFIVGLEKGVFPHYLSETLADIEEERRLFYVGITRAKQQLKMSSVQSKRRSGMENHFYPSPFIMELNEEVLDKLGSGNEFFNIDESGEYF